MDYSCGVKRIYQTNHRATKDKSSPPNPKKRTRQNGRTPCQQKSRRNVHEGMAKKVWMWFQRTIWNRKRAAQKNPTSGNNKRMLSRISRHTRKISVAYKRPNHGTYESCLMSETLVVSLLQISYKLWNPEAERDCNGNLAEHSDRLFPLGFHIFGCKVMKFIVFYKVHQSRNPPHASIFTKNRKKIWRLETKGLILQTLTGIKHNA